MLQRMTAPHSSSRNIFITKWPKGLGLFSLLLLVYLPLAQAASSGLYLSLGAGYNHPTIVDKSSQLIATAPGFPPDIDTPKRAKPSGYVSVGTGYYWHFGGRYFSGIRAGGYCNMVGRWSRGV